MLSRISQNQSSVCVCVCLLVSVWACILTYASKFCTSEREKRKAFHSDTQYMTHLTVNSASIQQHIVVVFFFFPDLWSSTVINTVWQTPSDMLSHRPLEILQDRPSACLIFWLTLRRVAMFQSESHQAKANISFIRGGSGAQQTAHAFCACKLTKAHYNCRWICCTCLFFLYENLTFVCMHTFVQLSLCHWQGPHDAAWPSLLTLCCLVTTWLQGERGVKEDTRQPASDVPDQD